MECFYNIIYTNNLHPKSSIKRSRVEPSVRMSYCVIFQWKTNTSPTSYLMVAQLDHYNSRLYNAGNKDIVKLQCVQHCLARVVTRSPRFSHLVPFLKSLHCIPVHYCSIFKICTVAYQALSSTLHNQHI